MVEAVEDALSSDHNYLWELVHDSSILNQLTAKDVMPSDDLWCDHHRMSGYFSIGGHSLYIVCI